MTHLSSDDQRFLTRAIEISRNALANEGKTPFGAVVVIDGQIVGEGTSSVVERRDPTAHAEVMALRDAGQRIGRHLFTDGVMYASSEPCPMCLTACYWAQIPRVIFGASSHDVATNGFEDLQLYRQLAQPLDQRDITEQQADGELHVQARSVLEGWSAKLPEPVEPKF